MFWFAIVLLVLLTIVVTGLLLPVFVSFHVSGEIGETLSYGGRIMAWGGCAGFGIENVAHGHRCSLYAGRWRVISFNPEPLMDRFGKRKSGPKSEQNTADAGDRPSKAQRVKSGFDSIRRVWPRVKQGWCDFWYVVRIDRCTGKVAFGLDDPAMTGMLVGVIGIVNAALPAPFSIEQTFDFTRRRIGGGLDCRFTIRLVRLWIKLYAYLPLIWPATGERRKSIPQETRHRMAEEVG
jgi:hypothetical protein